MLTLTVSADGAVPLAHRLLDGNTNDDQTHITTWDGLVALVGSPGFLYVADCKLATREQMSHIDSHHGRFLSILPRSRAEDPQIRDWAQTHPFDWTEAARRPGKRKGDPRPGLLDRASADPDQRGAPHHLGALIAEARL